MQLTHLKNADIDQALWDKCVENSVSSLPYPLSWYLNVVSPNWEALVSPDYKYIMPITIKTKYGLKYVVQPALTQQLGVFSSQPITEEIVRLFISKIPYLSYHINLNEHNIFDGISLRPNLTLALNRAYCDIALGYSKNCIRNIKKANSAQILVEIVTNSGEMLAFLLANTTEKNENVLELFKQIIICGDVQGRTLNVGARNQNGELIAAVCFLTTAKRWVYLLPTSNPEGKSKSAMFALIDHLIRENAQTDILLDFEGSKNLDIARFYRGFGATDRPYGMVKRFRPTF